MADEATTPESDAPDEQPNGPGALRLWFQSRITSFLQWATSSRLHKALVGLLMLVGVVGTLGTWSYLARVAVRKKAPVTLNMAFVALDKRDYEEAKILVGRLQQQANASPSLGGSLFVLGAAKSYQAQEEWSVDRQRIMHLVAARYLQRARALGVPPERNSQLQFLLGKSLIRGNQPQAGIDVLDPLLKDKSQSTTEILPLLRDAYLALPDPNFEAALEHNEVLLADESFDPSQRLVAIVVQAEILGQIGRIEEATARLAEISGEHSQQARVMSLSGRLALAAAKRLQEDSPERPAFIEKALNDLREAQRLDPLNGELTRQAMYWIGKCYELQKDQQAAIEQYNRIGKLYGDTSESIAATLSKADIERADKEFDKALVDYRAVLDSVDTRVTYVNQLLPLSVLQERLLNAHAGFIIAEQFEQAMILVSLFSSIFDQEQLTDFRGQTHAQWGNAMLLKASDNTHRHTSESLVQEGRHHLRAAGRDYEALAKLRYASREFTDDLWRSADYFYNGQSYSHAARVLEKYIHHESRRRKALALLRLGQSYLAINKNKQAADALDECIEMHPQDAVVYQARIECQQAYQLLGNPEKAEQLLLANLTGYTLTPRSTEWRDSLFALGQLLHDFERYSEATIKLEEAVTRYPDAPQALLARYAIARSFHHAAAEPAKKSREAKTESERQKNRKLTSQNLTKAKQNYLAVQRKITLDGHDSHNPLEDVLLRNCYMLQGHVLFQLKQYEEARKAYANVSTLYQSEPFVLESFLHIASCWRHLGQPMKARGTIEQAKLVLQRLPRDLDFKLTTNFTRQQWVLLLDEMGRW